MLYWRLCIYFRDFHIWQRDPSLINDLKADLRSECEKFGEVKKVIIFDVSCWFFYFCYSYLFEAF